MVRHCFAFQEEECIDSLPYYYLATSSTTTSWLAAYLSRLQNIAGAAVDEATPVAPPRRKNTQAGSVRKPKAVSMATSTPSDSEAGKGNMRSWRTGSFGRQHKWKGPWLSAISSPHVNLLPTDITTTADSNFMQQFSKDQAVEAIKEADSGPVNLKVLYGSIAQSPNRPERGLIRGPQEGWVRHQMHKREKDYTDLQAVTVCIGTWNVNGRLPKEDETSCENLNPWLRLDAHESPDIYVLG